jgi:hypothetical protein
MTTPIDPMAAVKLLQAAIKGMHAMFGPTETGKQALALTASIAQPTSEPVAWMVPLGEYSYFMRQKMDVAQHAEAVPLYAAQQALPATEQAKGEAAQALSMRDAFEACKALKELSFSRDSRGVYVGASTRGAWKAWKYLSEKTAASQPVREGEAAPAKPDLSGLIEIPPIPEMESEQDIDYLKGAPDDWDEDYKSTWKKLQIAARNKSQWRAYALQLRALLAAHP